MRTKIYWGMGILVALLAGTYFYFATQTYDDTARVAADHTVTATELLSAFATDNQAANLKYTEKIVEVEGVVSARETADSTVNIKMTDPETGSYIIFAFQDNHADEAARLREGDLVAIRGSCSGGVHSAILGTNFISFKRSALISKNINPES